MATRNSTRSSSALPDKIGTLLQESRWLVLGAVAVFLSLALWGYHPDDPGWSHATVSGVLHNPAGRFGAWLADLLRYLFGFSAWLWVMLLAMFVWRGYHNLSAVDDKGLPDHRPIYLTLLGFALLLLACATLEALRFHSLKQPLDVYKRQTDLNVPRGSVATRSAADHA